MTGMKLLLTEHVDHGRIDAADFADMAEIDDFRRLSSWRRFFQGDFFGADKIAVLAGQADRFTAVHVDQVDDLLVDQPAQHHLNHIHGLAVGDAHAVDEVRGFAEFLSKLADLRAAAMHDDRD